MLGCFAAALQSVGVDEILWASDRSFVGDQVPTGSLRLICGAEALTGLAMITWSASFMFVEMQRYWPQRPEISPPV